MAETTNFKLSETAVKAIEHYVNEHELTSEELHNELSEALIELAFLMEQNKGETKNIVRVMRHYKGLLDACYIDNIL